MQRPHVDTRVEPKQDTPDDFRAILDSDQAGGDRDGGGKALTAAAS